MAKDNRGGFIKIYRKIEESAIWNEKPFDRLHAWMWILLHANYKKAKILYKGKEVTIDRGQLITSYDKLAEAWGWSRNKVIRFTTWLTEQGMIAKNGYANGTTITVENYAFYQSERYTDGTADGTAHGTADGTQKKKKKKERIITPAGGGWSDPVAELERRREEERKRKEAQHDT